MNKFPTLVSLISSGTGGRNTEYRYIANAFRWPRLAFLANLTIIN